jgi:alcohol dehydrogenase (NADP+)
LVGLGTWKSEPTVVGNAVEAALNLGYRHIDCAALYANEKEIGEALHNVFSKGTVKRSDVWITSKVWNDMHAREEVVAACKQSLSDLQTDYLDLYLIHFPVVGAKGQRFTPVEQDELKPSLQETWQGMQDVLQLGLAKRVGVSNFSIPKLESIMSVACPAFNQIECHVGWQQDDLLAYCKAKNIHVTAYCPLGRPDAPIPPGEVQLLENPLVLGIASKMKITPAQVLLRWGLQRGMSVIPKSTNPARLAENFAVLEVPPLSEEDVAALKAVHQRRIVVGQFYIGPKYPHKTHEALWDGP